MKSAKGAQRNTSKHKMTVGIQAI